MLKYKIAIVGATGLVGREMIKVLEESSIKIEKLVLFASKKSRGKLMNFLDQQIKVQEINEIYGEQYDFVLFATNKDISKKYIPAIRKKCRLVVDNSSNYRMNKSIPLIVPEINFEDYNENVDLIANPNCSTIQSVMVLKPLDQKFHLKRVTYNTYQSVSGAGYQGVKDYKRGLKNQNNEFFPYNIVNNLIPKIDEFNSDGYTKEERKMIDETKKILHRNDLLINSTCIRVPILRTHGVVINCQFKKRISIEEVKEILSNSPGIKVLDDIKENLYPVSEKAINTDLVLVGRIRKDPTVKNGLTMFVIADNLRKGAASNAIQIIKKVIETDA